MPQFENNFVFKPMILIISLFISVWVGGEVGVHGFSVKILDKGHCFFVVSWFPLDFLFSIVLISGPKFIETFDNSLWYLA